MMTRVCADLAAACAGGGACAASCRWAAVPEPRPGLAAAAAAGTPTAATPPTLCSVRGERKECHTFPVTQFTACALPRAHVVMAMHGERGLHGRKASRPVVQPEREAHLII